MNDLNSDLPRNISKQNCNNTFKIYHHDTILDEDCQQLKSLAVERGVSARICKGYDVLTDSFYVVDEYNLLSCKFREKYQFSNFQEYYDYIGEEIYENSNYFQLDFSKCKLPSDVVMYKLTSHTSHWDNINNYKLEISTEVLEQNIYTEKLEFTENLLSSKDNEDEYDYYVKKYYTNNKFYVDQTWKNKNGDILKCYNHTFYFFSEFCYFLNNDLSNSDLLECEGLLNILDSSLLNFNNAKVTSKVALYLGIELEKENIVIEEEFEELIEHEALALMDNEQRYIVSKVDNTIDQNIVNYISDIHLDQKIVYHECITKYDIEKVILDIVKDIVKSVTYKGTGLLDKPVIIINGDTASMYKYFEIFVRSLRKIIDQGEMHIDVIFTLGNHELWEFASMELTDIYSKYSQLIESNGMYLLQNSIIYRERRNGHLKVVSNEELKSITQKELRIKTEYASIVFFGGIGFSGLDQKFNADSGIYKNTINRKQEVLESIEIQEVYEYVSSSLSEKNLVIITHMPIESWTENVYYKQNWIYITGHSHRNNFYDDLEHRVYSDNQIGYSGKNTKLKHLLINGSYEVFHHYKDGIYEITTKQYNEYLHAKNLNGKAGDSIYKLHMLKREGYYCFISESKSKNLCILNGGAKKSIPNSSLNFLFDNMLNVIKRIEKPLFRYLEYQTQLSNTIKAIGGEGKIHGCIIDIDYHNHIYVDPFNSSITPYFALSMTKKTVYPTLEMLLEKQNKTLLENYKTLIAENNLPQISTSEPILKSDGEFNGSTAIYKTSKEILKMQKLKDKTLSVWIDTVEHNSLESS